MTAGENILQMVESIIHELLGLPEIPIVRAMHLLQLNQQGQGFRHTPTFLVKVDYYYYFIYCEKYYTFYLFYIDNEKRIPHFKFAPLDYGYSGLMV